MPVLFKNEYVSSLNELKPMKERYFYFLFHSPLRIAVYSFILLWTIVSIIEYVVFDIWRSVAAAGLIYVAFIVFYEIFRYRRSMKIWQRQRIEVYGEQDLNTTYEITEDTLSCYSSVGQTVSISLDSVVKLRQSKNLVYLFTRARMVYTLRKNAFTVGSVEELVMFMRNKGVNAK